MVVGSAGGSWRGECLVRSGRGTAPIAPSRVRSVHMALSLSRNRMRYGVLAVFRMGGRSCVTLVPLGPSNSSPSRNAICLCHCTRSRSNVPRVSDVASSSRCRTTTSHFSRVLSSSCFGTLRSRRWLLWGPTSGAQYEFFATLCQLL